MKRLGLSIAGLSFVLILLSNTQDSNSSFKQEFLDRINRVRQAGCKCGTQYMPPAPPLVWNEQLEKAAEGHAEDMAKRNYFNHESKDGRRIQDRVINAGYTYKGFRSFEIGENIAFGQISIEEVQNGWFKSEGHCRNLMNPGFKEVGVSTSKKYWVQDFGGREEFSKEQQLMIKKGAKIIQKRG
ncbi:hypothetical protein GCM10023149_39950 [Mucilaginibacter gynuensis]|uniref:SCP domain-containing protein n=1 Tax=Mucilaginibacter gynuensis TaxID=1302236 RepID=A0ABP8H233_9SPHI